MNQDTELKRRILRKSLSLFFTYGYSRVTTQDIAESLGISKKTLYKYFASKHEIVHSAIEANLSGIGRRMNTIVQQDVEFNKKLSLMITMIYHQVSSIGRPFLDDMAKILPDVWQKIHHFRTTQVFGSLRIIMQQGQSEGLLRKDLDLDAVLYILFSTISSSINPDQLRQTNLALPAILHTLVDIFYKGMLTPDGVRKFDAQEEFSLLKEPNYEEFFFID